MAYSDEDLYIAPKILKHLSKDPVMRSLIKKVVPKINTSIGDVYADLLSNIVSQQISVKAAKAIYVRFLDLYDGETPSPEVLLNTEHDVLRSAGLSNQKTNYMQNIARFWVENKFQNNDWSQQSDQEIIELLTQIKGVGEWTVQMILMFSLERPDVLPVEDLIIMLSMMKHYNIREEKKSLIKKEMKKIGAAWSPYQSTACRYLWRAKDVE